MRRILKRFTGLFCVLALCLSMLPVSALAAEDAPSNQSTTLLSDDNVAKIEENEYPTLDEAVNAAEDGATIELLADATTKGWNLTKSLTITSAPDLAEKPTVTFEKDGIALWGKTLTFKGIDVVMNGVGSTPYGEWTWMTICASKDAVLALDNVNMTMDATGSTGSPHAIYFCSNNKLNLTNGSVLTIKNYPNDALEWDGGDGGYNVNITNSTFISDHNRSGFTGTFYATITNSKVDVVNSLGNGSNGSHFIIEDSEVNFNNNGSHGLSAGELSIDNSTVNTKNNNGTGRPHRQRTAGCILQSSYSLLLSSRGQQLFPFITKAEKDFHPVILIDGNALDQGSGQFLCQMEGAAKSSKSGEPRVFLRQRFRLVPLLFPQVKYLLLQFLRFSHAALLQQLIVHLSHLSAEVVPHGVPACFFHALKLRV